MKLVSVMFVFAVLGCEKTPSGPADAPITDARVDGAPDALAGSCIASSDCTDPANPVCCLICSPGGACSPSCGVMSVSFCQYSACDPAITGCTRSDGSPGTCEAWQPGPTTGTTYYRCI